MNDHDAGHLRGKDGRSAEDAGHGTPRPDENAEAAESPPGIQATHAGIPTNDPPPPALDDTGAGSASSIATDHAGQGRDYSDARRGQGRDTEGAFGEEEPR